VENSLAATCLLIRFARSIRFLAVLTDHYRPIFWFDVSLAYIRRVLNLVAWESLMAAVKVEPAPG